VPWPSGFATGALQPPRAAPAPSGCGFPPKRGAAPEPRESRCLPGATPGRGPGVPLPRPPAATLPLGSAPLRRRAGGMHVPGSTHASQEEWRARGAGGWGLPMAPGCMPPSPSPSVNIVTNASLCAHRRDAAASACGTLLRASDPAGLGKERAPQRGRAPRHPKPRPPAPQSRLSRAPAQPPEHRPPRLPLGAALPALPPPRRQSLRDAQHPKARCHVPSLVTFIICVTITTCLNTRLFFPLFFSFFSPSFK